MRYIWREYKKTSMKKKLMIIPVSIIFIVVLGAFSNEQIKCKKKMKLETMLDSASYSIGVNIAQNLKNQGITELNYEALSKAIADVLEKNELLISEKETGNIVGEYLKKAQEEKVEKNKAEGAKFLAENAKREGVISTASGLQYEILTEGTGPKPGASDKVKTHYHGTLLDGTVFDSSVDRGEAISFPVNGVIQGWQEALQLMPVGSKWKLYVPYDLAYGERGAGGAIAPFSTLIFEVELIAIEAE